MKKKKKRPRAFTLIELLAIIVVIAIIAVITVPIILNVVENARLGSIVASAYGYKDSIHAYYVGKISDEPLFTLDRPGNPYTVSELKTLGVAFTGNEPTDGEVLIENGVIDYFDIEFGNYQCHYTKQTSKVTCSKADDTPKLSITNVALTARTGTSLTLQVTTTGVPVKYEYSYTDGVNAATYVQGPNDGTYTYSSLVPDTRYVLSIRVTDSNGRMVEKTVNYATESLANLETSISNEGWGITKDLTMNFDKADGTFIIYPSVDVKANVDVTECDVAQIDDNSECSGTTITAGSVLSASKWYKITGASVVLTFDKNGNVNFKEYYDGVYYSGYMTRVQKIDPIKPRLSVSAIESGTGGIKIIATTSIGSSGVQYYQFSKDDGVTWTSKQISNIYTFEGLTEGTYNIKVKVANGTVLAEGEVEENTTISAGDAITVAAYFGGYKWKVISETSTTKTLLLENMALIDTMGHCSDSSDNTCDVVGDLVRYSFDKSMITSYLNTTFINNFSADEQARIQPVRMCIDPSTVDESTFGGFTEEEINLVNAQFGSGTASCSNYGEFKIRLMTAAEFYNISTYFNDTVTPSININLPELSGINKDTNWLKSVFWLSNSVIGDGNDEDIKKAYVGLDDFGGFQAVDSTSSYFVRPVITISK